MNDDHLVIQVEEESLQSKLLERRIYSLKFMSQLLDNSILRGKAVDEKTKKFEVKVAPSIFRGSFFAMESINAFSVYQLFQ